ncbi:hypothetical protein HU200_049823 [Digitaria exilis]|uniref:Uncharacterized protein n=1 Tax=Digitaria exilis TaxID=1010633 RepID=A0A835AVJ0_9POAL|nr:hypothetical protein HU200_049823 [Digitaria exilis]
MLGIFWDTSLQNLQMIIQAGSFWVPVSLEKC